MMPTLKGVNLENPRPLSGQYVGTSWLRPDVWPEVRPGFAADLAYIERNNLGRSVRLFIGLDQLMVWDNNTGFKGFDERSLGNLEEALQLLDGHGMRAIAVVYDQEVPSSPGNFRFASLDGRHGEMRAGYLRATEEFMARFGAHRAVAGWDLFNEAYNSLTAEGGLPRPPAREPVSPGYSEAVVHEWLRDLYHAARKGSPNAWLTVSDATRLYGADPRTEGYCDAVDFYDIHLYDDHPSYPDWWRHLDRPYIVGEAGASEGNKHFLDQRYQEPAVRAILNGAAAAGATAVLVQSVEDNTLFTERRDNLTATGRFVASFPANPR